MIPLRRASVCSSETLRPRSQRPGQVYDDDDDDMATPHASTSATMIKRGVREQVLFRRAADLQILAERLYHPLACKQREYALSTQEHRDWQALKAFLDKALPDSVSPYLMDDDKLAVLIGRLKDEDARYAEQAGSLTNLAAFAHALLAAHDAGQVNAAPDSQVAADLVACASAIARQDAPFHLVKDPDTVVSLLLQLRTHAILIAPEQERLIYIESLFGDGSTVPSFVQHFWRSASALRRRDLLKDTREHLQQTYAYDRTIATGLAYVRAVHRAPLHIPPSPPPSNSSPTNPSSQQIPTSVSRQISILLDGAGAPPLPLPAVDPRNNTPLFTSDASRSLQALPQALLETFLSGLIREVSPMGVESFHIEGGQGGDTLETTAGQRARVWFGPDNGVTLKLEPRPFSLGRTAWFESQADAERVAFDSQPASAKKKSIKKKKKKKRIGGEIVGGASKKRRSDGLTDNEAEAEVSIAKKIAWSTEETDLFVAELKETWEEAECWSKIVKRHGPNGSISQVLKRRNNVSLKDKARNLRLTIERRGDEVPQWLSAVSGLRKRTTVQRSKPEAAVPVSIAPAERLRVVEEETGHDPFYFYEIGIPV